MMISIMMSMGFVACGGDDDNGGNTNNPLVGSWTCSESEGSWSETRTYVFNNNGTGSYRQKGRTQKESYDESCTFNYTVAPTGDNSGIIKVVYVSGNYAEKHLTIGKDYYYSYNINGNTLFLNKAYGYGETSIETLTRR